MKKIVCAFDASQHAHAAARYALTLAGAFDARVTLVYVIEPHAPPIDIPGLSFVQWEQPFRNAAEHLLAKAIADLERETGRRPEAQLRFGSAANEIVRFAEDEGADLIVVGSHGHGAVKRLLVGSVADRVVHLAHVPVLIVR